tara:strand:- start:358 stop:678 length:321 start_codon:yes stop_codon:yes gene_type:complete
MPKKSIRKGGRRKRRRSVEKRRKRKGRSLLNVLKRSRIKRKTKNKTNIIRSNFFKKNINGRIESHRITQDNTVVKLEINKDGRIRKKVKTFDTIKEASEYYDMINQ